MPTLKQYSNNILNIVSGAIASDDSRLSDLQLDYWLAQYRAKLFPQITEYGKYIDSQLYQDLGAWAISPVDRAEDPVVKFGQRVLKLVKPIPETIQLPMQRGMWIGALDKRIPFIWTTAENVVAKIANKFTQAASIQYVYRVGASVYVTQSCNDTVDLQWVNVRACLQDPTQGHYYYTNGSGIAFNRDTSLYPLNPAFADVITKMIIQTEFNISSSTIDMSNDASDIVNPNKSKQ